MLECDMNLWYNTLMENICVTCPRSCGVNRQNKLGYCKVNNEFVVARAGLHFWEEPCVSGTKGSGAIFFSGCNLGCIFCQNREISRGQKGKKITKARLEEIFYELKEQGAHNINLVTPSHYVQQLATILDKAPLPIVWNSSAYETVEALSLLKGKVSVYLPDFKFGLSETAQKYASAADYPERAKEAILEMFSQTGAYKIENGIIKKGVIIRHLVLPDNLESTCAVIDWVAKTFKKGDVLFSLMSQYTPYFESEFAELNRRITKREYILARNYMLKKGLRDGFVQELSSAKEEYTPAFDLTGV